MPSIRDMNSSSNPRVYLLSADAVLKALNLSSPKGGDAPRVFREKPRHAEKPTKYAGSPKGSSAPRVIGSRVIHQPR